MAQKKINLNPSFNPKNFWKWVRSNKAALENVFGKGLGDKKQTNAVIEQSVKLLHESLGVYLEYKADNENQFHFILTANESAEGFFFVEQAIDCAPKWKNWSFKAFCPPVGTKLEMKVMKYLATEEKLNFYANENPNFPDDINITILYDDYEEKGAEPIRLLIEKYLSFALGEYIYTTVIDRFTIIHTKDAKKELIPLNKLQSYLKWRQSEFIEKYETMWYGETSNYYHEIIANYEDGKKAMYAMLNTAAINWYDRASHPWLFIFQIQYDRTGVDGAEPTNEQKKEFTAIHEDLKSVCRTEEGFVSIGKQIMYNKENFLSLLFGCKDYRLAAQIGEMMKIKYGITLPIRYVVRKDKYWQHFAQFSKSNLEYYNDEE